MLLSFQSYRESTSICDSKSAGCMTAIVQMEVSANCSLYDCTEASSGANGRIDSSVTVQDHSSNRYVSSVPCPRDIHET
jgi:hypothetical protein